MLPTLDPFDPLDIEKPTHLQAYLTETRRITPGETIEMRTLSGGVSNRTVWVRRENGEAWVIKQALAKLRVQVDWFSDPGRIHCEALGLEWLPKFTPPGTIPALVFEDLDHYILAMQAIPQPHDNWKTLMLAGTLNMDHVRQFGQILGSIHGGSSRARAQMQPIFADQTFFDTLRIEAYYRFTASQNPTIADFYHTLIADMLANRESIVHGDYSPKNVLVHHGKLILLDHEVMHFGDPGFDIGFSMTHLLSKAHHLPALRTEFAQAARLYWETYLASLGDVAWREALEERAVRHVMACLLARVDGRSPLEYLSAAERTHQRRALLSLMGGPPPTRIPDLIDAFIERL
ncbi:MAG: phosphotransferase [Anaerolineae bacterium]